MRGLGQILPSLLRALIHQLAEATPEVVGDVHLATGCRHFHFGTLEGFRHTTLLLSDDFLLKLSTGFFLLASSSLIRSFSRVGAFRTEEVVDIVSEHIGVGEHQVHCRTLFTSGFEHQAHGLTTLNLLDEGILNGTGIGVQKLGSLGTKVLKNLKGLIGDLAEVTVTYGGCALLKACGLLLQQVGYFRFRVGLG